MKIECTRRQTTFKVPLLILKGVLGSFLDSGIFSEGPIDPLRVMADERPNAGGGAPGYFVAPFQGATDCPSQFWGRYPGYYLAPFQGARANGPQCCTQ